MKFREHRESSFYSIKLHIKLPRLNYDVCYILPADKGRNHQQHDKDKKTWIKAWEELQQRSWLKKLNIMFPCFWYKRFIVSYLSFVMHNQVVCGIVSVSWVTFGTLTLGFTGWHQRVTANVLQICWASAKVVTVYMQQVQRSLQRVGILCDRWCLCLARTKWISKCRTELRVSGIKQLT